ncbi:hypothetical protein AB0H28_04725 [Micromonospora sp. NPDC050980]|uniref:hypothetical protein n=1 Tax=Micromonospora sp. NPDC050980 TaxID=3155161 RepID=UPI0033DE7895
MTLIAFGLLPGNPASAGPQHSTLFQPSCSFDSYSKYNCSRRAEAWNSNSTDPNSVGPVGAFQSMTVYYSPNRSNPQHMTYVDTYAYVRSSGTTNPYQRLRMEQTIKALDTFGVRVNVSWQGISVNTTDPVYVSNQAVFMSMTRQNSGGGSGYMSRYGDFAFTENVLVYAIEMATTATIEYPSGNTTYRLLSQVPLTDH